jgi:RNA polymerase sigma-70 factor, ECF subfamily
LLDGDQLTAVTEGLRAGRAEAWAALYDAYALDAWRFAARLVGGDHEATADVVQEAFLAAARSARSFDPERGSLRAWLMGIVHHQVLLHWRRERRGTRGEERGAPGRKRHDGEVDPADELLRVERAEHVRRVLSEMPSEYAWLLVAKYVDDRPIAAMAAETAAGTEAVRSKLARARRLFRNAMTRQRVGR